jgi:hypothetical protein
LRKRRSLQSAEVPNTKVGVIAQAYSVLLDELKNEALKDSIEGPLDKISICLLHPYLGLGYGTIARDLAVSAALMEHHMIMALATINNSVVEFPAVDNA